jgi:aminopeptidase N
VKSLLRAGYSLSLLFLLFVVPSAAQTRFDRRRVYDVQHYTIRVSFDAQKKTVYGDTTVKLTPLGPALSSVDLDAVGMRFTSVRFEGAASELQYKIGDGTVNVQLGRTYQPGEIISIRLKYTIIDPKKGVFFIPAATRDGLRRPAQIWTQNEPEDGRYWFPSFDFPSDKATSEEFITVQKGETAIGNGALIENKTNPDGTVTFHYRMDVPYSTYLTSFVVGNFSRLSDKHGSIPLGFYTYRDRERVAGIAFSRTQQMMAAFESVTGFSFPYPKYDQVMVSGFDEIDGMENITATTLADSKIFFAEFSFGRPLVDDLVSHELAHSWFGNMVTCRNWSELWLNEGFATFMEAIWRERFSGRDAYLRKLLADREEFVTADAIAKSHHALQNMSAKPDNSLFDATTYQKGSLVLHMLRETVGDQAFWKAVNLYLNRHKFDTVVSSDLVAAMEEASGQKLDWFFSQWVYAQGYPRLEIQQKFDASTLTSQITVTQTQRSEADNVAAYRFALPIELSTSGGPIKETLAISKRSETFSIKVPSPPTKLTVDPSEKIILKSVKIVP